MFMLIINYFGDNMIDWSSEKLGWDLEFVLNQTKEICLCAVKQEGYAIMYVKEQTEEICLAAVRQNGLALKYVKEQTEFICSEAIRQDKCAIIYVDKKFVDVFIYYKLLWG